MTAKTTCPPLDVLERLLAEALGPDERAALEGHLAGCVPCQERLAALTGGPDVECWRRGRAGAELPPTECLRRDNGADRGRDDLATRGLGPAEPLPPAAQLPRRLPTVPGYEVLGELGRGGMAVVYRARQLGLSRLVALKMILPGPHAAPGDLARLRAEAEAAARLQHPNIVQVFEVGEHDGLPFFSMELCAAGTLAGRLATSPVPPRAAAAVVEALARAVHHAHRQGIVHRDLKPSNVLLQAATDVSAISNLKFEICDLKSVVPKVADFGLAKRLDGGGYHTPTGSVLGTPSYMAPEQALAAGPVGPAADVYALGAVLYEALAGRPPFQGATPVETVVQVVHADPRPPRRLCPAVPRDLDTICLKCLRKEPRQRYASAQDLADDLRRFLDGEPVRARPVGAAGRALRWARRRPAVAALLAVVGLGATVGFPGATALWLEAEHASGVADASAGAARAARALAERNEAEAEAARAEADRLREASERREARLALDHGQALCEAGEFAAGLRSFLRGLELAARVGDPALEHAARVNLADWSAQVPRPGPVLDHGGSLRGVSFTRDGKTALTVSWQGKVTWDLVRCWDADAAREAGPRLETVAHNPFHTHVWFAACSPARPVVVTGRADGQARLWDLTAGRPFGKVLAHELNTDVWQAAFSPDGHRVATAGNDRTARLWSATTGEPLGKPLAHPHHVHAVAFSPDGTLLLTGCRDGQARLWDAASGQLREATVFTHPSRVMAVAFSPDGRLAATGCSDGSAHLWDVASGHPVGRPFLHLGDVGSVAFSPDGDLLLTGSADGSARLWSTTTGRPVGSTARAGPACEAVAFRPDGRAFATAGHDGKARLWHTPRSRALGPALEHRQPVLSVAFSADGRTLLSGGQDRSVAWDSARGVQLGELSTGRRLVGAALDADGRRAITATWDRQAILWDVHAGAPTARTLPITDEAGIGTRQVALTPDGQSALVVATSARHDVQVWDTQALRLTASLPHPADVTSLALSRDGQRLATACDDGSVSLWDLAARRPLGDPLTPPGGALALAFRDDGAVLAVASSTGSVRLFDVAASRFLPVTIIHPDAVLSVAFVPGGAALVTGCADGSARVWDTATGVQLGSPLWHRAGVAAVAVRPDSSAFASGGRDATVRLWSLPAGPVEGSPEEVRRSIEEETGLILTEGSG
jgi:WD40 repeat protein